MTATHETLILGCEGGALPAGVTLDAALAEFAELNAYAAHAYFVERHVKGVAWKTLKASLTDKFGFTDRQMSSIAFLVDGRASWKA